MSAAPETAAAIGAVASETVRRRRAARAVVTVGLVLLGVWIVGGFLPALLWAVVVAIAIEPLVARVQRRLARPRPALLAAGFTFAFGLLVVVPLAFGIAQAAGEARDLTRWITDARANGVPPPAFLAQLPGSAEITRWWQTNLSDPAVARGRFLHVNAAAWLTHTRLIGAGLLHRSVIFAFTLITLFFLLRDREALLRQTRLVAHRFLGPAGERIGRQAALSVRGTIDGLVLVGLGEGAVMAVAYVVLGVPHPLLLGAFTAIAAMIPFGAALLFGIAALLLLAQGAIWPAVAVIVIGLAVVGVADHVFRPALIGQATRLPFVWVLVGILGGVERLGLLGLFVGPATMAVLVMLWREIAEGERDEASAETVAVIPSGPLMMADQPR